MSFPATMLERRAVAALASVCLLACSDAGVDGSSNDSSSDDSGSDDSPAEREPCDPSGYQPHTVLPLPNSTQLADPHIIKIGDI